MVYKLCDCNILFHVDVSITAVIKVAFQYGIAITHTFDQDRSKIIMILL